MNNNDPEIKEFQDYLEAEAESQNKDPKEYIKSLGEDGIKKAYKRFLNRKKKAAHGAKLNYFKSLKNQCAKDEEIVYYKEGGFVTCGCEKKEHKGEIVTAKSGSAIEKFKKMKKGGTPQINQNDTIHVNGQIKSLTNEPIKDKNNTYKPLTSEEYKKLKNKDKNRVDEKDAARGRQVHKCGGKVKKECGGSKVIANFKAKCGTKMKKHKQGGSLNGIPFMQAGTPKGGIKKEYILPEYMKRPITGAPTILPGRGYSGLERPVMGLFNMFKTWIKGLPKTITLKDYLTGAAGVAGGTVLGYDDTHNQYVKKGLQKANEAINDQIEWRPFSTEHIIEDLTNPNKKTPKFKK